MRNSRIFLTSIGTLIIVGAMTATSMAVPDNNVNTTQSESSSEIESLERPEPQETVDTSIDNEHSAPIDSNLENVLGYATVSSNETGVLIAEDNAEPIPYDDREWTETQSPELGKLSDALMEITDKFPDNLSGVAFSSQDQYLEVFVKAIDGPRVAEVIAASQEMDLAGHVVLVKVDYSLAELDEVANEISLASNNLASTSVDFLSNSVVVNEQEDGALETVGIETTEPVPFGSVDDDVVTVNPALEEVTIEIENEPTPFNNGRYDDSSPYYMGARIVGGGQACSLGVPIVVSGTYKVLTAGHCVASSFSNGYTSAVCWKPVYHCLFQNAE